MQTYEEYLETMKAYKFVPLSRELWEEWQIHYHGYFLPSEDKNMTDAHRSVKHGQ